MLRPPVEAMLARSVPTLPVKGCFEPKWDGFRCIVFRLGDGLVVLQSRQRRTLTAAFPELVDAVLDQVPVGVVLDAELVVWVDGRLDFSVLLGRARLTGAKAAAAAHAQPASLVAFDLLAIPGGLDVRGRPLRERRALLEEVLAGAAPPLHVTPHTCDVDVARRWLLDYAAADVGIEGVMVKDPAAVYAGGRRGWAKHKIRTSSDAIAAAVLGTVHAPRHLVVGLPRDGQLHVAGTTTVLDTRAVAELVPYLHAADPATHPWPSRMPGARFGWSSGRDLVEVTLVEPLVVEVAGDAAFDGRRWRHAVRYGRARPDVDAGDVGGRPA